MRYRKRLQRGEVTPHFLQHCDHEGRMSPGNARKRFLTRQDLQAPYLIYEGFAVSHEINAARPAIRRIVTSLQRPAGFQAVKGSHESHRLKTRQLRQPYLADSFMNGQI
jgi:hypothetical protein